VVPCQRPWEGSNDAWNYTNFKAFQVKWAPYTWSLLIMKKLHYMNYSSKNNQASSRPHCNTYSLHSEAWLEPYEVGLEWPEHPPQLRRDPFPGPRDCRWVVHPLRDYLEQAKYSNTAMDKILFSFHWPKQTKQYKLLSVQQKQIRLCLIFLLVWRPTLLNNHEQNFKLWWPTMNQQHLSYIV